MEFVLRHKEYGTFYCFDKEDKYKHFSVHKEKAYRFNRESSANRILNKLKHPDRWQIIGVKDNEKR
jgi:hypothetical protein